MIGFDVSAVRSIMFTFAVYIGIGTPPILISQTKQLVCQYSFLSAVSRTFGQEAGFCSNQQLFSSSSDFSLSLEWTLFNPNGGFCPAKNSPPPVIDSLDGLEFEPLISDEDDVSFQQVTSPLPGYAEICPIETILTLPVCYNSSIVFIHDQPAGQSDNEVSSSLSSVIDLVISDHQHSIESSTIELYRFAKVTDSTTDSPRFLNEYQPLPGPDSGALWYHEQLTAYLCNVIISALPETWTKWITSNHPTLDIICVTVMYGSLLWPLLFVLWRQMKSKRRMTGELKMANGAYRVMHSRLFALLKEKKDLTEQLSRVKRLEGETQNHRDRMAMFGSECSYLLVRVADLTEEKQSLEAENLLVKYAKESVFASLAALQVDHEQAKSTHRQQIRQFNRELEKKTSLFEEYADENGNLKELVALLEVESKNNFDQLREMKQKIEGITEFFHSKEDNLLTKLAVSEKKLQQYELLEFEIQEKGLTAEEKMEKEQSKCSESKQLLQSKLATTEKNLEHYELLEFEAQEKLINAEEKMEKERNEWKESQQLLQSKLATTEKKLQWYELLEFEAQEKRINAEERTEEEHSEWKESKQLLHKVIQSIYFQAELCKDQARDGWRYQQEMRLANREINELRKRLNTERELREATIRRQTHVHLARAKPSGRLLNRRLPASPPGPLFKTIDVKLQTAAPEVEEATLS